MPISGEWISKSGYTDVIVCSMAMTVNDLLQLLMVFC